VKLRDEQAVRNANGDHYKQKMPDEFDELLSESDEDDDGILDLEEDYGEVDSTFQPVKAPRRRKVSGVESASPKPFSKKKLLNDRQISPSASSSGASAVELLASAIQAHEGWFPPGPGNPAGSASYRNNNPGNLKYVGQGGAIGTSPLGFAVFPDFASGRRALIRDIGAKLARHPDHSIISFITQYEGGDPANPPGNDLAYAKNVARMLSEARGKTFTINTKINAV